MSNTNQPIPPGPRKLTLRDYRRATELTRECTGFDSFAALLTAQSPSPAGYRPVLYTQERRVRRPYSAEQLQAQHHTFRRNAELADLYDRAQLDRGDARRAVRL